jgi:hypothetical protein
MKRNFNKILVTLLFTTSVVFAQDKSAIELSKICNASRIEQTTYKLLMFNQNKDAISNPTVVERTISRENYKSQPSIKITETNQTSSPNTRTVIYIDATTLKPLYFEASNDGTPVQKASFDNNKVNIVDISNGTEKLTEMPNPADSYLSNSFSELVQANDFGKNRLIRFGTFSPGKPINRFVVERVREHKFEIPGGKVIDCWILKFTKTDSNGVESLAGYRYVDKRSGKVLMYKSDLKTDSFFTYQIIFLKD